MYPKTCNNMLIFTNLVYLFLFKFHLLHLEHDDRDRAPSDMTIRKKNGSRRVSFKTSNAHQGGKQNVKLRAAELGLRTHFEDDDERMVDFNGGKSSTFRRRNSPIPGGARNKGKVKLIENASEWFQAAVSIRIHVFGTNCFIYPANRNIIFFF